MSLPTSRYRTAARVFAIAACLVWLAGCEQKLPNEPGPDESPKPVEPQSFEEIVPTDPARHPVPQRRGPTTYPAGGYDGTPYRYAC